MILNQDVVPKQPSEVRTYNGNWARPLARQVGVTIASSVWSIVSPVDGILTLALTTGVSGDGLRTSFQALGGVAGTAYVLKNTITLTDTQVWMGYTLLRVESEATLLGL